jgi:hypothetical protein
MLLNTEIEFLYYFAASFVLALELVDTVGFVKGRSGLFRSY